MRIYKVGSLLAAAVISMSMSVSMSSCARGGAHDTETNRADTRETPDINSAFSARDMSGSYDADEAVKVELTDDGYSITEGGVYILSGKSEMPVTVDAGKSEKVQIVLSGVEITAHNTAALFVNSADKVFVTLAEDTENTLSSVGEFVSDGDVNIDGAIFARDDITINGSGSLTVVSECGHGIVAKDEITITGGSLSVTAQSHAIDVNDAANIADGTLTLISGNDGIHAENDDDDTLGNVLVAGGVVSITSGDDGIHASGAVTIADGDIVVTESHEGIEGAAITVSGGNVEVTADDDGFNAADGSGNGEMFGGRGGFGRGDMPEQGGSSAYISITGGSIRINADGDGLDSNGSLYVSGGVTYVDGPENSGNGALDCGGDAVITGGVVIASGASGMAQSFGPSSTQCSILYNFSAQSSGPIVLRDQNGDTVASFTPAKTYNSVVISAPALAIGETYTLEACGQSVSVTLDSAQFTSGAASWGFPGGGSQWGNRRPDGGEPPMGGDPPAGGSFDRRPR